MSPRAGSPPAASAASARSAREAVVKLGQVQARRRLQGCFPSGAGRTLRTEGAGAQFRSAPGIAGLFSSLLLLVQPAMILHT